MPSFHHACCCGNGCANDCPSTAVSPACSALGQPTPKALTISFSDITLLSGTLSGCTLAGYGDDYETLYNDGAGLVDVVTVEGSAPSGSFTLPQMGANQWYRYFPSSPITVKGYTSYDSPSTVRMTLSAMAISVSYNPTTLEYTVQVYVSRYYPPSFYIDGHLDENFGPTSPLVFVGTFTDPICCGPATANNSITAPDGNGCPGLIYAAYGGTATITPCSANPDDYVPPNDLSVDRTAFVDPSISITGTILEKSGATVLRTCTVSVTSVLPADDGSSTDGVDPIPRNYTNYSVSASPGFGGSTKYLKMRAVLTSGVWVLDTAYGEGVFTDTGNAKTSWNKSDNYAPIGDWSTPTQTATEATSGRTIEFNLTVHSE